MVDTLTKVGRLFLAPVVAPLIMNAGQVGAEPINKPSPTFPENHPQALVIKSNKPTASLPPSSPMNPNSGRGDVIKSLSTSSISIAQRPVEVDGQRTPPPPPPNYGKSEAGAIADLQQDINRNNNQLVQGLKDHNQSQGAKLQEILNRTKN
jgi:hypothetical protein